MSAEDEKGNLKFSSTMSAGDFFKLLQSKGISEKDYSTLLGTCIISTITTCIIISILNLIIACSGSLHNAVHFPIVLVIECKSH